MMIMEMLETSFLEIVEVSRDAAVLALVVGGLLLLVGKKITPAWRHGLWLLVAARLILPLLPASPTSWQQWLVPEPLEVVGETTSPGSLLILDSTPFPLGVDSTPALQVSPSSAPPTWTITRWLALVWIAGVLIFLAFLVACMIRFRERLRRFKIADHPQASDIRELVSELCREVGIKREPGLTITGGVSSPALTGLVRQKILLPSSAIEQLAPHELRLVLFHELGHLRRCDLWLNWVIALLQVVHWFNPIVWWVFHRTRIESERATDAWVLHRAGTRSAKDYGDALIRLLELSARGGLTQPGVVGVLESRKDLQARIREVGSFSGKKNWRALAFAVFAMSALAAVGLTQPPLQESNPLGETGEVKKNAAAKDPNKSDPIDIPANQPEQTPVSRKIFPAPLTGSDSLVNVEDLIKAYLRSPDWQSRIALTYEGARHKKAIEEYYKKRPYQKMGRFSLQYFGNDDDSSFGGPYWAYLVSKEGSDETIPLLVRKEGELLKVDWEVFAEFKDRQFSRYLKTGSSTSPQTFRLVLENKSGYRGPDRTRNVDPENFFCFEVSPPYGSPGEYSNYAFVKKGTETADTLSSFIGAQDNPLAVTVSLQFREFADGAKHLVITDFVTVGWFRLAQGSKSSWDEYSNAKVVEETESSFPPKVTYQSIRTSEKVLALTFDDGPHRVNTPRLLDILKKRKVTATFFVVGNMIKDNPEILRQIANEGHEIGNHTQTHSVLSRKSDEVLLEDLRLNHKIISNLTGAGPKLMRPPGGAIKKSQKELMRQELGYTTILWSVDPQDWKKPGVSVVTNRLVTGAKPGSILLTHDIHATTIDAIPEALDQLLEKGFRFVTVSELIAMDEGE